MRSVIASVMTPVTLFVMSCALTCALARVMPCAIGRSTFRRELNQKNPY